MLGDGPVPVQGVGEKLPDEASKCDVKERIGGHHHSVEGVVVGWDAEAQLRHGVQRGRIFVELGTARQLGFNLRF